jgi:hypothetical protein
MKLPSDGADDYATRRLGGARCDVGWIEDRVFDATQTR